MAFDKNTEGQPIVQADKRTTRVNIWVVIAVLVFLLAGVGALVHVHKAAPPDAQSSPTTAK